MQTGGADAAGGFTVPTTLANFIIESMLAWGPMYDPGITTEIVTSSGNIIAQKRWVPAGSNARVAFAEINLDGVRCAPASSATTGHFGPTPSGAKEVPLLVPAGRPGSASTSTGWVGYTSRLRLATTGGRANGDKLVDGSSHWIYASGVWVPWDSSTPTLS